MARAAHVGVGVEEAEMPPAVVVQQAGDRHIFVGLWELDLSRVQSLIWAKVKGTPPPDNWVEALLNGACIADLDERAAQLVGAPITRTEMIGRPLAAVAPPDSWATMAELIVAVASDIPHHAERIRTFNSFVLSDARLRVWGASRDAPSSRIWVAVEGVVEDDRSRWALKANEQRYRRLIHHLPCALLQVDARHIEGVFQQLRAEGVVDLRPYIDAHPELVETARETVKIIDANDAAVELLGATDATFLNRPVGFLFTSPDAIKRVLVAHFNCQRSYSEAIKLPTFDGRQLDVKMAVTFPNPAERLLDVELVTLEDMTERLRTESQLRQLQVEFDRATRIATLGELTSSIAHEVNQPLAAITMNGETSLRWLSRDEPNLGKVAQLIERIVASARHAGEVVQRIRGMAVRHAPDRMPICLNEVAEESLLFVQHDLYAKAIELVTDFGIRMPRICGDPVQLRQVIINLLVNSIQALGQKPQAGGSIELTTGSDEDGTIFLEIRDNGPGISSENLDRIFGGFFTTKDDGMGIGLSVCQTIITTHGGRISASNHPDGGAVFRFCLPGGPVLAQD